MTVVATYLDGVKAERVRWLWTGRLARGKLTVSQGDPGLGKTSVWLDVAARLTRGHYLPGESDAAPPMVVGLICDEDGVADTLVPRLDLAEADKTQICQLTGVTAAGHKRSLLIPDDTDDIIEAIRSQGIDFLYVDPLAAHAGAGVKLIDDQDVRAKVMGPLANVGEETGVTICLTRHPNKQIGTRAMYRGGGSLGIIGAARFGLTFGRDPEDLDRLVVAPVKVNIGPMPASLAYRLVGESGSDHARVVWEDAPCFLTADDILNDAPRELAKAKTATDRWLVMLLALGPKTVDALKAAAEQDGHGWRSVERSKGNVGVEHQRVGYGEGSTYWWLLPGQTVPAHHAPPNGPSPENVASMASMDLGRHTPPYIPDTDDDPWRH